jgi:gliding motility-associated-like protein
MLRACLSGILAIFLFHSPLRGQTTTSITITGPTDTICVGASATFTAVAMNAGVNPRFQWVLDGQDVGTNSTTYTFNNFVNNDVVTCLVTADPTCTSCGSGFISSNGIVVHVTPLGDPVISVFTRSDTVCIGDTALFTAGSSHAGANPSFTWEVNGVATGTTGQRFLYAGYTTGDVVQCLLSIDQNYRCALQNSVNSAPIVLLAVNQPNPSVTIIGSPAEACQGEFISFAAVAQYGGSDDAFRWMVNGVPIGGDAPNFGSGTLHNGDRVTCQLIPGHGACEINNVLSDPIVAVVDAPPIVNISPGDTVVAAGTQLKLDGAITGGVGTYQWTPTGILADPQSLTPVTLPLQDTVVLTLTVKTAEGCVSSASAKVLVYRALVMPNAFTPNGDGVNDVFRIPPRLSLQLTEMDVYDRLGVRVFATRDINTGWNGTFDGHPAPAGAYVYVITGVDIRGPLQAKGMVMLVR